MTYTQNGDRVTLEMTRDEHLKLIYALGLLAGSRGAGIDTQKLWLSVSLVNAINNGNPNFTPYPVPEEYQTI